FLFFFFFSSRRRHTRSYGDWSSDVCSSDLIRSAHEARCEVYALTPRPNTPSRPLRLNFYEQPESCIEILASLLQQDNKTSNYIRSEERRVGKECRSR